MKRTLSLAIISLFILNSLLFAQDTKIKFATVAPEGTTWINVMKEYDQAVRKESGNKLGFSIFAGAVQGDEQDILRKIKLGQLHSAGITGNGLTTIAPKTRILDTPFLFKSTAEVDNIYQTFDAEFNQAFSDGGYVLLGWAEVGFVNIYTNSPVTKPEDLNKVKMWMWQGDPVAEATFKAMNVHPTSLALPEVITSLQTGLIDGVYASPLACISLQWSTKVKYMLTAPLADACGAVVISKKKFDSLSKDLQEILLRNGKKYMKKLTDESRKDNQKSLEALKKTGVQFVDAPKSVLPTYDEIGKKARQLLVGKVYDQNFLSKVEQSVADFRKKSEQHQ